MAADKYTQAEIDALGAKGHAFKGPDGTYSYPVDDAEDLDNAIHAVGRGNADHDAIRKYIIGRADDLGLKSKIPENWTTDGSLDEAKTAVIVAQEALAAAQAAVEARAADDKKTCPTCDGTGKIKGGSTTCPTCDGSGKVAADYEAKALPNGRRREPARVSEEFRALRDAMCGTREVRRMPTLGFEMREVPNGSGGTDLICSGYASTTCRDYDDTSNGYEMEDMLGPWTEYMVSGFATKTIREGCDTAFLVNHGGVSMARTKPGTLKLAEDTTGLHYEARLNPTRPDVQILRAAIEDGAIDESSFAFRPTRQKWSPDYDERWITEITLDKGDVSPVNYGANPHTADHPLSMRSAVMVLSARGITAESFADALREIRAGKTISAATASTLQPIYDHLMTGAQVHAPALADLLGMTGSTEDDEEQPSCNRCGGDGTISMGSQTLTCPQCGGSGDASGNAAQLAGGLVTAPWDSRGERARLEALRYGRRAA